MNVQPKDVQESEYIFPYHYIPSLKDNNFSQVQYWAWGFRYMGGMKLIFEVLKKIKFSSVIDIGCGDGRFLSELYQEYPSCSINGIDYSSKAINFAKAMNPEISKNYEVRNIINDSIDEKFDVATLIEVLEHIEIDEVDNFLKSIADILNKEGHLLITVPHVNKAIQPKHYQHFDSKKLREILSPYYEIIDIYPFDKKSKIMSFGKRVIGGKGKHFILTDKRILNYFFDTYIKYFLYTTENKCDRIAVLCKKK